MHMRAFYHVLQFVNRYSSSPCSDAKRCALSERKRTWWLVDKMYGVPINCMVRIITLYDEYNLYGSQIICMGLPYKLSVAGLSFPGRPLRAVVMES